MYLHEKDRMKILLCKYFIFDNVINEVNSMITVAKSMLTLGNSMLTLGNSILTLGRSMITSVLNPITHSSFYIFRCIISGFRILIPYHLS